MWGRLFTGSTLGVIGERVAVTLPADAASVKIDGRSDFAFKKRRVDSGAWVFQPICPKSRIELNGVGEGGYALRNDFCAPRKGNLSVQVTKYPISRDSYACIGNFHISAPTNIAARRQKVVSVCLKSDMGLSGRGWGLLQCPWCRRLFPCCRTQQVALLWGSGHGRC